MNVRPSEVQIMFDDYILVEPDGDIVYNEEIQWVILDEKDKELFNEWFN